MKGIRSKTRNPFEVSVLKALTKHRPRGASIEYESERLPYVIAKTYVPDFIITLSCGRKIYIEAKGYFRPTDRIKMLAVKRMNPTLDIRIVFAVDNKLNKGSKSRYSDWCEKHGFPYAVGLVPKNWMNVDE